MRRVGVRGVEWLLSCGWEYDLLLWGAVAIGEASGRKAEANTRKEQKGFELDAVDHTDELLTRLRPRHDYWKNDHAMVRFQRNYAGNERHMLTIDFTWWDFDTKQSIIVRAVNYQTKKVIRYRRIKRQKTSGFRETFTVIQLKGGTTSGTEKEDAGG